MMRDDHRYEGRFHIHELPTEKIQELLADGIEALPGGNPAEVPNVILRLEIELIIRRLGLR